MAFNMKVNGGRLLVLMILTFCIIQTSGSTKIRSQAKCTQYKSPTPVNSTTGNTIEKTILLWQGVVLLLCFGAFALLVVLIHRLIRTYIYYDGHLLDTFFDGGGDINFGLLACSITTKWVWTSSFTWSTKMAVDYGIAGHFWFAAGTVVPIFLFAIIACEIRIKAPGAKTYLQVIYSRFGVVPHAIIMGVSLITIFLVCGMLMSDATRILTSLTQDLGQEVTCIILSIVIGLLAVVGGVGGGMYVAYFACAFIMSAMLVYLTDMLFNTLGRHDSGFSNITQVYNILSCAKGPFNNQESSYLTFLSKGGMMEGIVIILCSFSHVFVDQTFWQTGIAGKPPHSVWGFLSGGLVWFSVPFCLAFTFGISYIVMIVRGTLPDITNIEDPPYGISHQLPIKVSHQLLGTAGDFLIFTITMVAVVTTVAGEILAASSIVVYDIYQTYISPFNPKPVPEDKQMSLRMQRAIRNEEYIEYDRRSVIVKHVVVVSFGCLLIPITLLFLHIPVNLPWLFKFTGIVAGSSVIPIALAITWHRIRASGVLAGCIGGFWCGFIAWLIYSSTLEGGLREYKNTGTPESVIIGCAFAIGMGGLLCVAVSLPCGGCDKTLLEEEEWEKTRHIDNPILPWSVKYAPDIGASHMAKGRPHFYTVRRAFKCSEILAYIVGVLLSVCCVLVWPACMLISDIFSQTTFNNWTALVVAWGGVATAYIVIVPLVTEIVQTCRQAYYNRLWARTDSHERLSEIPNESTKAPTTTETTSNQTESEMELSGRDSGIGTNNNGLKRERWKTYIQID